MFPDERRIPSRVPMSESLPKRSASEIESGAQVWKPMLQISEKTISRATEST